MVRAERAFALIELLVVVAIVTILAAILFPVFAQAKESARKTQCLSNLRQIGIGMVLYTDDSDGRYPTWAARIPPLNGGTSGEIPPDLQLMPYIKNDSVFKCPSDELPRSDKRNYAFWDGRYRDKELLRSYAYVGTINTNQAGGRDLNTGLFWNDPGAGTIVGRPESSLERPTETVAWVEQWPDGLRDQWMGVVDGSGFINCDTWKLAGRRFPPRGQVDFPPRGCNTHYRAQPTPGHGGLAHYIFADGHVKGIRWEIVRRNDFFLFKVVKPVEEFTP